MISRCFTSSFRGSGSSVPLPRKTEACRRCLFPFRVLLWGSFIECSYFRLLTAKGLLQNPAHAYRGTKEEVRSCLNRNTKNPSYFTGPYLPVYQCQYRGIFSSVLWFFSFPYPSLNALSVDIGFFSDYGRVRAYESVKYFVLFVVCVKAVSLHKLARFCKKKIDMGVILTSLHVNAEKVPVLRGNVWGLYFNSVLETIRFHFTFLHDFLHE